MKIDLSVVPTTFDTVHAALAATVVGLFFLQMLFLLVVFWAFTRKGKTGQPVAEPAPAFQTGPEPVTAVPAPAAPAPKAPPAQPETIVVREATPDAALQLLGLLQKEARFLDFIQENVGTYSDAEIGAAARVVHEGCVKVIRQHFELAPVRSESEGSRITLPPGFDAAGVRLIGNIVGQPPFTGTLIHRGFRAAEVKLPRLSEGHDAHILAQAEVEL
jgi:hypothetical protein